MRILVAGASGFIGSRLVRALAAQGHHVVGASRSREPHSTLWAFVRVDFAQVPEPAWWVPQLQGIDVVINAVGIFRESGSQTFDALHHRAPVALFTACALAHVPTVIQVSALGTLVASRTIAFVGPAPLTLRHYLAELRLALGLAPPAVVLELPGRLCLALACVAGRLPASFVDRDAVSMLLMNLSVALVWIWTGLVSLGLYPVAGSLRLLADFGLHGALAKLALYSAAVLDLGLWGC